MFGVKRSSKTLDSHPESRMVSRTTARGKTRLTGHRERFNSQPGTGDTIGKLGRITEQRPVSLWVLFRGMRAPDR